MTNVAMVEAALKPRIFSEFIRNYDGNQFPRGDIAVNVLETMGVARDRAAEVFERIVATADRWDCSKT
jgi:hypothetical protein